MSDFEYEIDEGRVTITNYTGRSGDVIVPSVIDGFPVTRIGDNAFCYCAGLTSITLPEGCTTIGYYAFSGCRSLTSITLPSSLTSIGDSAFERCVFLTSISLPDGCSIGEYAFEGCPAVITVRLRKSRCYIYFRDKADIRR